MSEGVGFVVAFRVQGGMTRSELMHPRDELFGLPWDLEVIELSRRVQAALFTENVLGWFDWELDVLR